ncbi:MAG: dUTP diphosphatase [Acidimicrobiales bacterium]
MTDSIGVRVVRLDPDLALPAYARVGDAGMDLVARHDTLLGAGGGRAVEATGIAIELPAGWAAYVLPRSGLAAKHGVTCLNAPGVIDSGYRDELKVILANLDPRGDYPIVRGDRIAQLVVSRVVPIKWTEVTALSASERGGGFGHTGR